MENYSASTPILERRSKPRMKCNYPAVVQGHGDNGKKFREEGRVLNMSRSGIYVELHQPIPYFGEISIRIAMPTGILQFGTSNLATTGTVTRSETHPNGTIGVAIKLQNFKFL